MAPANPYANSLYRISPQALTPASVNNPDGSPEIDLALSLLGQIKNDPADVAYLKRQGINLVFDNGAQAQEVIRQKGVKVIFGDMGSSLAHAQWMADANTIMINQRYRGDFSKASLYAISEAIYHEAGHAAWLGDDQSSLQEELDCLALNTLGYRYHVRQDPAFANTANDSRLIQDGVALYNRLFFDSNDPSLIGLQERMHEKYGSLPAETPDHRIPLMPYLPPIADRVCRHIQNQNSLNLLG